MITNRQHLNLSLSTLALVFILELTIVSFSVVIAQSAKPSQDNKTLAADLTGNWAVRIPNADGTSRVTYLNLKQDGSRITGSIRVTQFYYLITDSTGGADGFTITGTMRDGKTDRKVQYEGKLAGDELHISTRRRPTDKPTEMVAVRAPAGEGALP